MSKLVLVYGIVVEASMVEGCKGVNLFQTEEQTVLGVEITKGGKCSIDIPFGEDYTENYFDHKFYSYTERLLSLNEDNEELESILENETPVLYVLNIKY